MRSVLGERSDSTRNALLEAARQQFGTHGYADTSLDALVHDAGVTKGAFYHYFGSKQDIFQQVFEAVKRDVSRAAFVTHVAVDTPFAGPPRPSATQSNAEVWENLILRCRRYVELHIDPLVRRIVLLDARSVLPPEDWQKVENEHGAVLLRADLRRLTHRGVIRPMPLAPLARILAGSLNEACMLVADADDTVTALDDAVGIIQVLLEGLRLPS